MNPPPPGLRAELYYADPTLSAFYSERGWQPVAYRAEQNLSYYSLGVVLRHRETGEHALAWRLGPFDSLRQLYPVADVAALRELVEPSPPLRWWAERFWADFLTQAAVELFELPEAWAVAYLRGASSPTA